MIMVDEVRRITAPSVVPRVFWDGYCHLTTDGPIEELHAFAGRLGVRRAWFQDHRLHPHYDLTVGRRDRALELGAVYVSAHEQARRRLVTGGATS